MTGVQTCALPISIEQELEQIFVLTDQEKQVYRCKYCEAKFKGKRKITFG